GFESSYDSVSMSGATSVQPLRIGRWASEWFAGAIDQLLVFSRPLTSEEIAALIPPSNQPSPSEPVLSYDMENLTADGWMKDLSRHGNHGTINGSADVAGNVGRARECGGLSDCLELPDS